MSLTREEYLVTFNLFSRSAEEERDHGSLRAALIDQDAALRQRIAELETAMQQRDAEERNEHAAMLKVEEVELRLTETVSMCEQLQRELATALKIQRDYEGYEGWYYTREQHAQLLATHQSLYDELTNIANANTKDWDDPSDFKAWAQNRAKAALRLLAQMKGKP